MWPWEHAVAGYVLLTALSLLVRRRPLTASEVALVVLGTQIPDLVDKPLAWTVPVLPGGRSLGHSLLTWAAAVGPIVVIARRIERTDAALAFLFGFLVHILTDLPPEVLAGEFSQATFVLWPLLPIPETTVEQSILARFGHLQRGDIVRLKLITFGIIVGQVLLSTLHRERAPHGPEIDPD